MTPLRMPDNTDSQMEKEISRSLLENGKSSWIQVIARDGYINLFGFVDGPKEKREITDIVQSFPGVRVVTNHLRIKLWEEKRVGIHF